MVEEGQSGQEPAEEVASERPQHGIGIGRGGGGNGALAAEEPTRSATMMVAGGLSARKAAN